MQIINYTKFMSLQFKNPDEPYILGNMDLWAENSG